MLYEVITEDIWGFDVEGNERTVDVHVNRLRERFPEQRFRFRIVTIRGLGYRLEACQDRITSYNVCYTKLLRP